MDGLVVPHIASRSMRNAAVASRTGHFNRTSVIGHEAWKRAGLFAATGCLALSIGILVYLMDRDASQAALVPLITALAGRNAFGVLGHWLPSFVHPFAFSLFTAAALSPGAAPRYVACAAWCAVNVGFELAQHTAFKSQWVLVLSAGAGDSVMTRPVLNYLLHGTFDFGDVLAAILGALAAVVLMQFVDHRLETHHASQQVH